MKKNKCSVTLLQALFLLFWVSSVSAKECSNIFPTQSHSFRYIITSTQNLSSDHEALSQYYHLTPTDDSAWSSLLPKVIQEGEGEEEENELSWAMLYRKLKNPGGFNPPGGLLKEIELHDVRLGENSLHWRAQQTNLEYLLMLDVDRLVWSFRKTARLHAPGKAYGGWEAFDSQIRGHFVGHYLSATAQMWASTGNSTIKEKMSELVSALSDCQQKIGTGYLSAFPDMYFTRLEALLPVWAPYYTIHKIMVGLLDQHTFAHNPLALNMTTWMADYFYNRVQNVIKKYTIERHWTSLNDETGGMNDVLYRLYALTKDPKHLVLAQLFDKPCFLGSLALQADHLSGFHANTHIPIVLGVQKRYEITGEPLYKAMSTFFMDTINSSHTFATGGITLKEHWTDPKRLASSLGTENEESCSTYNMLKVSRYLFKWTKEIAYADYYERALTNGVLSIQRGTEPGVMIYMLPLHPGASKAKSDHGWGKKFKSFWCCYGTGTESFSKLGDSIYFEEEGKVPGLYIIQYISSTLKWKSGHMMLDQKVSPVVSTDPYLSVSMTISVKKSGQSSILNLRIPSWTKLDGAKATLNKQNVPVPSPGTFLSINRKWNNGDKLTLQLPITLRTEAIRDDRPKYASIHAILYGPYLLAGHSKGDWNITAEADKPVTDWVSPVAASYNDHLVTFTQALNRNSSLVISASNTSIRMEKFPKLGTDDALYATFRLIFENSSSAKVSAVKDVIGETIILEPFDLPGSCLAHQGSHDRIEIRKACDDNSYAHFRVVKGLDGRHDSISLESHNKRGCYIYNNEYLSSGTSLKLSGSTESRHYEFKAKASFRMQKGLSSYHPISFIARGKDKNFVLSPLLGIRDESYTVYFNIKP